MRRLSFILLWLLFCLIAHEGWRLLRQASPWPRRFLGVTARLAGVRISVRGQPLTHDVFFVSNHIGWIEIPVIAGVTGAAFVAQAPLQHWPVLGFLANMNRTIYVSRIDRMQVGGQIDRLKDALEHHQPVVIFPEGTTSDGHGLLPFKPSLFAALDPPPRALRVQPIVLKPDAAGQELAWVGEETGVANAWRLLSRRGTWHMEVQFLEAFSPLDYPGRKVIAGEAFARMQAALIASQT